jgi:transcriptional regulator with XRE-family HTH domain
MPEIEQRIKELEKMFDESRKSPGYQYEYFVIEATEALCELMEEQGVSKEEILDRTGKSSAWFTNLLHGHKVSVESLTLAFWALGYGMVFEIQELQEVPHNIKLKNNYEQLKLF